MATQHPIPPRLKCAEIRTQFSGTQATPIARQSGVSRAPSDRTQHNIERSVSVVEHGHD